jgi:hemerythrin-like domain-containing protein
MQNVTKVLSEEHQNILKVIEIVLNECNQLEDGKEPVKEFFEDVLNFIKKYADGFHHVKEEDILFKAMLQNQGGMHCNPIPVMLMEHDEGRNYVKGMETALNEEHKQNLIENARGYYYLLQQHIYKEDHILYPMAEEALGEHEKQKVDDAYNAVNQGDFFTTDIPGFIEELKMKYKV